MTPYTEVLDFLRIAGDQGFINSNTVNARRTACSKFFEILDDGQKSVEYMLENLDIVKTRFQHLHPEVRGQTADEYARRVAQVLEDFTKWKTDRSGWEREVAARGTRERPASTTTEKKKARTQDTAATEQVRNNTNGRTVTFPLRPDFDITITIPREGFSMAELRRLGLFLLPYGSDLDTGGGARMFFPGLIESNDEQLHQ